MAALPCFRSADGLRLFGARTKSITKQDLGSSVHKISHAGPPRALSIEKTVVIRVVQRNGAGRCSGLLMRARRVVTVQQLALSFFELSKDFEVSFTDKSMSWEGENLTCESFRTLKILSEVHDSPRVSAQNRKRPAASLRLPG